MYDELFYDELFAPHLVKQMSHAWCVRVCVCVVCCDSVTDGLSAALFTESGEQSMENQLAVN